MPTRYQSSSRGAWSVPETTARGGIAWARWKSFGSCSWTATGSTCWTGAGGAGGCAAPLSRHAQSSASSARPRLFASSLGTRILFERELPVELDDALGELVGGLAFAGEVGRLQPDAA